MRITNYSHSRYFLAALLLTLLSESVAFSQEQENPQIPTTAPATGEDPTLDAKSNSVRNELFEQILSSAESTLTRFPPTFPMRPDRRPALLSLDGVFNDPYVINRKPLQEYYHRRIQLALKQIKETHVAPEQAVVWHTYNMGFVVKTATVTMAFDLIAPSHLGEFQVPSDLMHQLVQQCDILFTSHMHQDHADPIVAKLFAEAGKPIIGPTGLSTIDPVYNCVLQLKPYDEASYDIPLANGRKLTVWIFPGQQEIKPNAVNGAPEHIFVQNNVYVVRTGDGITIAHNGDQNDMASWPWIDKVNSKIPHIDALIYNTWANPIGRYIKGFKPSAIILAHANELGHKVPARYPYWKAVNKGEKAKIPFYVMTWGESIRLP